MARTNTYSRRTFLTAAAAAAGACVFPGAKAHAAARMRAGHASCSPNSATVRVGLVGCGRRGRELAQQLHDAARHGVAARITAVADVHATVRERVSTQFGAVSCPTWQALIERADVDAVIIAAPDHAHAAITLAALHAGKDVYCETPMALTAHDALQVRDAATQTGRILAVGAEQAAEPQWRAARAIIASGELGALTWCQGDYKTLSGSVAAQDSVTPDLIDWPGFIASAPERPFDAARYARWQHYWDYSGGIATEVFYPKLAAFLVALEATCPMKVSAAGGIYTQDGREVPDSLVMTCSYANAPTVVLASAMANAQNRPAIIRGELASLKFLGDHLRLTRDDKPYQPETIPVSPGPSLMENWLACTQSREACICGPGLGYWTSVSIAMAMDAYRTRTTQYC